MIDRPCYVRTSELSAEDRSFKLEQEKKDLERIEKSNENLIKLNNLVSEVVLNCLELKENPLKLQKELKPLIARSLILNENLDRNEKYSIMLGLELDYKSTKELIEIKSGEKSIYKVYLAAKMFFKFSKENLPYMNQAEEIERIVGIELKQSLKEAFIGENLDTKTLFYLAEKDLLK